MLLLLTYWGTSGFRLKQTGLLWLIYRTLWRDRPTKCYMGILLPTLVSLKTKLSTVRLTLKYCTPLADALLQGVDTRFQGYMDRQDLVLASLTMPQFRLRWLPDEAARQTAKLLLCSNVAQLQCRSEQVSSQTQPEHVASDNAAGQSNSMEEHFFISRCKNLLTQTLQFRLSCIWLIHPKNWLALIRFH